MNRARWKSFFTALDPALLISETATSHLFLVFSFRPSWSSSTPAYGTLLPWGRTTRRPLPVSPFFSHLFSPCSLFHCRFRHMAKPTLSVCYPLALAVYIAIYLSFCLAKKGQYLSSCQIGKPYHVVHSPWHGYSGVQRNTKGL